MHISKVVRVLRVNEKQWKMGQNTVSLNLLFQKVCLTALTQFNHMDTPYHMAVVKRTV